jgi:O-antigen ligase
LATLSVIQYYSSAGKVFWVFATGYPDGVFGPFVSRNQFAAWLELLLPAALWLAATDRRRRPLWGCTAAILFAAAVASASRGGFALMLLEIIVAGALLSNNRTFEPRRITVPAVQFAVLATILIAAFGWKNLHARLFDPAPETLRLDAVRASIQMIRDHPWTGYGLGTWSQIYPRYAGFDSGVFLNQAHNDWLQWASEGGLPFLACFGVFGVFCCIPAVRSIYGLGVFAFLLHACVDYPMQQRPVLAAWFFVIAGAVMAQNRRQRAVP